MSRSDTFEEIRDIADAVCDGDATPEQMQQLEVLLEESSDARRFYLEYVGMHAHMKVVSDPKLEMVMRRQVDEIIFRPTTGASGPPTQMDLPQIEGEVAPPKKNTLTWILLVACLILAITLFATLNKPRENYIAKILNGRLVPTEQQSMDSKYLNLGEFTAERDTTIELKSGDVIELKKDSKFQLLRSKIELVYGVISIKEPKGENIELVGAKFTLNSEGSTLKVDNTQEEISITSGNGTVISPQRWRPKHYWSFDSKSDRALDFAGDAHGIAHPGVKKVDGLLGYGAFEFDNSIRAMINVGSGGGTAPATGTFAVSDGVTIEALIKPRWTGKPKDLDEIFRKDQTDQELRMLLSFQNDKGKPWVFPPGDVDESLGFGLFLVGPGYHELKLPLDGKEGRPTLADLKDGNLHHVVATYDVRTGLKAIYIDGVRHAAHNYPPGSKMLSGGSGIATIGNSPNNIKEAFNGIIDEVAFYDFGLPEFMIKEHYRLIKEGKNYYGIKPNARDLPEEIDIKLPTNQSLKLDPLTGLPSSLKKN